MKKTKKRLCRECEHCGEKFNAVRTSHIFCTPECKTAHANMVRLAAVRHYKNCPFVNRDSGDE